MKNINKDYAVTNESLFNQYYDNENVVTRNSILNIIKSRAERGDDDANGYYIGISVALLHSIKTKHIKETTMIKSDQLQRIVRFAVTPDYIYQYISFNSETNCSDVFEIDGVEYYVDDYSMVHGDYEEPLSVEFMSRFISKYDPDYSDLIVFISNALKPILENGPYTALTYLENVFDVMEYVKDNLKEDHIPMSSCTNDHIHSALMYIEKYGTYSIKKTIKESITPRCLHYKSGDAPSLKIKQTLHGGFDVSSDKLTSVVLSVDNWGDKKCKDQYTLKVNTEGFLYKHNYWEDTSCDDVRDFYVASHLVNLSVSIIQNLSDAVVHQDRINKRGYSDVFVYDKQDAESIIAMHIATTRRAKNSDFDYDLIDINSDIDYKLLNGKNVCFLGVLFDDVTWLDHVTDVTIVNLSALDKESFIPAVWDYYVGSPKPMFVRLFDGDEIDYLAKNLLNNLSEQTDNKRHELARTIVQELLVGVCSPDNTLPKTALPLVKANDDGLNMLHMVDFRIK